MSKLRTACSALLAVVAAHSMAATAADGSVEARAKATIEKGANNDLICVVFRGFKFNIPGVKLIFQINRQLETIVDCKNQNQNTTEVNCPHEYGPYCTKGAKNKFVCAFNGIHP